MTALIVAILGACMWVILSAAVGNFADKRGHSGTLWYVFSLLFSPLIGFAFVAALPSNATLIRHLPPRHCPHCSAAVEVGAEVCRVCHRELLAKPSEKIAA